MAQTENEVILGSDSDDYLTNSRSVWTIDAGNTEGKLDR
jgi:hypothetical protein